MAIVKIIGVEKLERMVRRKTKEAVFDATLLNTIGKDVVKRIKFFVGKGKHPETGEKYEILKPRTIQIRKRIASAGGTGQFYRADKSNLHLSGQLWRSIKHFITKSKAEVIVQARGTRAAYELYGEDKITDNKELARIHDQGLGRNPVRKIYALSKKGKKSIRTEIVRHLRRKLLR